MSRSPRITTLPDKPLLSLSEILNRLNISGKTLWRWIDAGKFPRPALVAGQTTRFDPEIFQQWMASQTGLRRTATR